MAQLTYSDNYTNVKKYDEVTGTYTGIQIASKLNQKNGQDYKLLDAIDIDWNGIWISQLNTYINNTEDLIVAIDTIADLGDLEWIKDNINNLNEEVDTILATYVTQDQLAEILSHFQKPITGGEHITIDENNIVSTYNLLTPTEADEKYAYLTDFTTLKNRLDNDYYPKIEADYQSYLIAYQYVLDNLVKNADEQFDNLEKVSDFLSNLPLDDINNIADLEGRVDRLDEVVGYSIYNEEFDTYTYTGLILDTYNLKEADKVINQKIFYMQLDINNALDRSNVAYDTATEAYSMAYTAYTASNESTELASQAYEMAYDAKIKVGNPHSYGYFVELTEEEIAILNEDYHAIEVYSIRPDNTSGIPLPDIYNADSGLQYYTYVPDQPATGFYKDLDDVNNLAYHAKYSADTALFRLYSRTDGTAYARIELEPEFIDDSLNNSRTIVLELDEADIDELSGYISKEGIITTYSLVEAFSYAFRPEFITNGENLDNNG